MQQRSAGAGWWGYVRAGGAVAFAASIAYFAWAYATWMSAPVATAESPLRPALANAGLFAAFALHHSLFARAPFKALMARLVPPEIERAAYVWIASLLFAFVTFCWQPVPGLAWQVDGVAAWLLHALQASAVVIGVLAGRQIGGRNLAGTGGPHDHSAGPPRLSTGGPYRVVRHPLSLALLLAVWPVAVMTGTRLTFALLAMVYVLIATPLEERDLARGWGAAYDAYRQRVRFRLIPYVY
jgi:protein-S-isoprenylcysteine O-methyltransferase Ste14